ncbi:type IV pilin protein [Vibrio caribbeanicus]|uniref:type IV pilin protein n=1 Tax=Vibrio caribbeanicus TaxID=701175 RepID=UPI0030D834C7
MFMEKYYRATLKQINKVTLIEVVCTVLILIILAAIMYPNYQSYVLKAHRISVMSDLTQLQLELEQHHQNSYIAISNTLIGADGVCHLCKTEPERFALSILVKEYGYSIVAQAKGEQLNDHCSGESYQYLSLNHRGETFPEHCW